MAKNVDSTNKSKLTKLITDSTQNEKIIVPKTSISDFIKGLNKDEKWAQFSEAGIAQDSPNPQVIPTGILQLDYDLNIGGFPRGRIVMLYGPPGGFKSTACLRTVAQAQRLGGNAIWLDAEHSFDKNWAAAHGVDCDNLGLIKIDTLEDGLQVVDNAAHKGIDVIVLDSLAMAVPLLEKYMDDTRKVLRPINKEARMALAASIWTKWTKTGPSYIAKNGILFLIINQVRNSLDQYGPKINTPGGNAIKHVASLGINFKQLNTVADKLEDSKHNKLGQKYQYTIEKTRFDMYGKTGKIVTVGEGKNIKVDNYSAIRDIAIQEGFIVPESGSWWNVEGQRVNGKPKILELLVTDTAIRETLETKVRQRLGFNIPKNIKSADYVAPDPTEIEDEATPEDEENNSEE